MSTFSGLAMGSVPEPKEAAESVNPFELPKTDGLRHFGILKTTGERIIIIGHRTIKEQSFSKKEPEKKHEVLIILFERLTSPDQLELMKIITSDEAQNNDYLVSSTDTKGVLAKHIYPPSHGGQTWEDFLLSQGVPRGSNLTGSVIDSSKVLAIVPADLIEYNNEHQRKFIYGEAPPVNIEAAKQRKLSQMYSKALEKMRRGEQLTPEEKAVLGNEIGMGANSDVLTAKMEHLESTVNKLSETVNLLAQLVTSEKQTEQAEQIVETPKPKTSTTSKKRGRPKKSS